MSKPGAGIKNAARATFLGTALGFGLLGTATSLAGATSTSAPSGPEIAGTSAQQLARLPDPAKVQGLPSGMLAAHQTLRQLLVDGTQAQGWSDAQVQAFASRVQASAAQHRSLAGSFQTQQANTCFATCAAQFVTNVGMCGTGLGGILCELIDIVAFDLCAVACILGGLAV